MWKLAQTLRVIESKKEGVIGSNNTNSLRIV